MEQKITSSVERITPDMAREYLKFNNINRPLKKNTVKRYAEQMKNGTFLLNGETIIFSDGGVLMQGQHRLTACVLAGVDFESVVVRGIDCDSFHALDSGSNRSTGDVFSIFGSTDPNNLASIVNSYIRLHRGINKASHISNITAMGYSKKDILDVYESNKDSFDAILPIVKKMYNKTRLLKLSIVGGIMAYLVLDKHYHIDKVSSFFNMLHFGRNISCEAIAILRDKLIFNISSSKRFTDKHKYALIIKAWNAYITGRDVKQLAWNEEKEDVPNFI